MASITCKCGKVSVVYPSPPIGCLECCCVDCYQRYSVLSERNNTPMPEGLEQHGKRPLLLHYLPGKFKFDAGENEVMFNKMREDANSIQCCCKHCWSVVAVDHVGYGGQMLSICSDFCPIKSDGYDVTPLCRLHVLDFEKDARDALEPMESVTYLENGEYISKKNALDKVSALQEQAGQVADRASSDFRTFKEIKNGSNVEILGIPEMANSARLKTKQNQ